LRRTVWIDSEAFFVAGFFLILTIARPFLNRYGNVTLGRVGLVKANDTPIAKAMLVQGFVAWFCVSVTGGQLVS
jgi:hypothetical protein